MKYSANNFTYGIELEGVFSKELINVVEDLPLMSELHGDGSVDNNEIIERNGLDRDLITSDGEEELSLGIFTNMPMLLKTLARFENNKNYWTDKSCGLHLHVKPKRAYKEAKEIFWDLKLIKKLEKYAYTKLCPCVRKRKNTKFCMNYSAQFRNFYRDYRSQEKYRFVKNHEQGTLEFRFLAPCEHKAENVKKFVNYMASTLSEQTHRVRTCITLTINNVEETRDIAIKIKKKDEEIINNYIIY